MDRFLSIRVGVNGVMSDWAPVLSGASIPTPSPPPCTVLGPLLFCFYINDITSDIESEIRLFADDCVCYREIKNETCFLFVLRLNVPVNNFSVTSGRSHPFLGN